MTVTRQFLRLQRTALLVWGAVLVLLVFAVTGATPAVAQADNFAVLIKTLGPMMQGLAGGDLLRFASPVDAYVTFKLLASLPAFVGVYVVLTTGAVVAREQARGTLDFLLALPLERGRLLRSRFLAVALGTALLYGVMWLCLVGGLAGGGVHGSIGRYAQVFLADYAVNMAQGGLVLLLSVVMREHAQVIRWGLGLALGGFLLNMALQVAGVLTGVRYVLLYGLADAFAIVAEGRFPWGAVLVGASLVALCLWWSGRLFARKELQ